MPLLTARQAEWLLSLYGYWKYLMPSCPLPKQPIILQGFRDNWMPISENVSCFHLWAADASSCNGKISLDWAECWNVNFVTIQRDVKIGDKGIWRENQIFMDQSGISHTRNDATWVGKVWDFLKIILLCRRLGGSVWEYWWWWPGEQKRSRREKYWEEGRPGSPTRPPNEEGKLHPGDRYSSRSVTFHQSAHLLYGEVGGYEWFENKVEEVECRVLPPSNISS